MSAEPEQSNDGENLFDHFAYASWAPQELQELYPTLESALTQLETDPNPEAAFALLWLVMESPDLRDLYAGVSTPEEYDLGETVWREADPEAFSALKDAR